MSKLNKRVVKKPKEAPVKKPKLIEKIEEVQLPAASDVVQIPTEVFKVSILDTASLDTIAIKPNTKVDINSQLCDNKKFMLVVDSEKLSMSIEPQLEKKKLLIKFFNGKVKEEYELSTTQLRKQLSKKEA